MIKEQTVSMAHRWPDKMKLQPGKKSNGKKRKWTKNFNFKLFKFPKLEMKWMTHNVCAQEIETAWLNKKNPKLSQLNHLVYLYENGWAKHFADAVELNTSVIGMTL